ncbi:hypothetical protein D3C75_815750 [compost metagenome]
MKHPFDGRLGQQYGEEYGSKQYNSGPCGIADIVIDSGSGGKTDNKAVKQEDVQRTAAPVGHLAQPVRDESQKGK